MEELIEGTESNDEGGRKTGDIDALFCNIIRKSYFRNYFLKFQFQYKIDVGSLKMIAKKKCSEKWKC